MIGAMPAVAVRHERRRQEKRSKRPSQLYLGGPWLPPSPSASPSPGLDRLPEYYLCGKVSALHMVVGSLLLGGVVLVVGLVQLSPGAEAAAHRYYLLAAGAALICLGLALTALRCFCIHCSVKAVPGGLAIPAIVNGGHHNHHHHHTATSNGGHAHTHANGAHTVSSIEGLVAGGAPAHLATPPSEADALIRPPAPAPDT